MIRTGFFLFLFLLEINASTLLNLKRKISYSHNYNTIHFHIYWGDDYPKNDFWLNKKNDLPLFIYNLANYLENVYKKFNENNLTLPPLINVYLINSGLEATDPYLKTENIGSLGAFTSDTLPEILINSQVTSSLVNGKWYSYKAKLESIVAHELTHTYQYQKGLYINREDEVPKENRWFFEGLATASQKLFANNSFYDALYLNVLVNNLDKGFFSIENNMYYTCGYIFSFLVKKLHYSYNDFVKLYMKNNDKKIFFQTIAKENNLTLKELFELIYNSIWEYTNDNIKENDNCKIFGSACVKNFNIKLKKGWNLISLPYSTSNFNNFKLSYLSWNYKNNKWNCLSSDEKITNVCKKLYKDSFIINLTDGFWIKVNKDVNKTVKYFDVY
jgi:hypothetical protein